MKDKRSSHTVITDRWDLAHHERIRREMPQVAAATSDLEKITPTARPEMFDIFQMFMKADPQFKDPSEIRDDHMIDQAVNTEALDLPEFRELRRFTRGDLVAAGMAAAKIEPTLETVFDRMKFRQRQAEELQKLRDELMDKLQQMLKMQPPGGGGEGQQGEGQQGEGQPGPGQPGEGQQGQGSQEEQDLQSEIDALKQAIAAAEVALRDGLSDDQPSMAAALSRAMEKTAKELRTEQENARAYGVNLGQLRRMNAAERIKLASRLNNARLRRIAELFGPMHRLAFATKQRIIPDMPHEMTGVNLGGDLSKLLPSEILRLASPEMRPSFLASLVDRSLLNYQMQGREKVGKGGIVVLVDTSGSMQGAREEWAKALLLVLMNIAKIEGRQIHVIFFSGPGQTQHFGFESSRDFTVDRIIEVAEYNLAGGTSFETPLNEGMELLEKEHRATGRVQSDIILVTDGECHLTDEWLEKFHERRRLVEATTWGIRVGNDGFYGDIMEKICTGLVCDMEDLGPDSNKNVRDIFAGVRRKQGE
jgi:uncharacterized protein with von Willebrand factor type A (vWA) domain